MNAQIKIPAGWRRVIYGQVRNGDRILDREDLKWRPPFPWIGNRGDWEIAEGEPITPDARVIRRITP
jgi:hypothetical protein